MAEICGSLASALTTQPLRYFYLQTDDSCRLIFRNELQIPKKIVKALEELHISDMENSEMIWSGAEKNKTGTEVFRNKLENKGKRFRNMD